MLDATQVKAIYGNVRDAKTLNTFLDNTLSAVPEKREAAVRTVLVGLALRADVTDAKLEKLHRLMQQIKELLDGVAAGRAQAGGEAVVQESEAAGGGGGGEEDEQTAEEAALNARMDAAIAAADVEKAGEQAEMETVPVAAAIVATPTSAKPVAAAPTPSVLAKPNGKKPTGRPGGKIPEVFQQAAAPAPAPGAAPVVAAPKTE